MEKLSLEQIDAVRKQGLRPQVVGCFLNNQKLLFVYHREYNLWQLPQGGIDNFETVDQAFLREMTEEMGEEFTKNASSDISIIGEDLITFPLAKQGTRELKTDDGKDIFMEGKKYFFAVSETSSTELEIEQTEFDDYKWVSYAESLALADTIYQKGKQRTILKVLETLKEKSLLA